MERAALGAASSRASPAKNWPKGPFLALNLLLEAQRASCRLFWRAERVARAQFRTSGSTISARGWVCAELGVAQFFEAPFLKALARPNMASPGFRGPPPRSAPNAPWGCKTRPERPKVTQETELGPQKAFPGSYKISNFGLSGPSSRPAGRPRAHSGHRTGRWWAILQLLQRTPFPGQTSPAELYFATPSASKCVRSAVWACTPGYGWWRGEARQPPGAISGPIQRAQKASAATFGDDSELSGPCLPWRCLWSAK